MMAPQAAKCFRQWVLLIAKYSRAGAIMQAGIKRDIILTPSLRYRDAEGTGDWTLFHSRLPSLPGEILTHITRVITQHPLGYAALRPLLLFDGLPGRDQWARALDVQPQDGDAQTRSDAVSKVLDHQSQEATDVRWLSLLFKAALGALHFPVA